MVINKKVLHLYQQKQTTMIKTTDIKGNLAGYSESFFNGENQIHIYKDLTDKMWRVVYHYGMREMPFDYKQEAVDFINELIKKRQK